MMYDLSIKYKNIQGDKDMENIGIFSEVADLAKMSHRERLNVDSKLENLISDTVDCLCELEKDGLYECLYKEGVKIMFKWVAHALIEICNSRMNGFTYNNLKFALDRNVIGPMPLAVELHQSHKELLPLHKLRENFNNLMSASDGIVWGHYNVADMYTFFKVLVDFDFSEFDISGMKFDTGDSDFDDTLAKFVSGERKPSNIDLYIMFLIQARGVCNLNPRFMEMCRHMCRCKLFMNEDERKCITGILLEMLLHYSAYEKAADCDLYYFKDINMLQIIEGVILLGDYYGQ